MKDTERAAADKGGDDGWLGGTLQQAGSFGRTLDSESGLTLTGIGYKTGPVAH